LEFNKPAKSSIRKSERKRNETNNPQLQVLESFQKLFFLEFSGLHSSIVCLDTHHSDLLLPLGQEGSFHGRVGELPEHEKGKAHGDRSKDYINPFPRTFCINPTDTDGTIVNALSEDIAESLSGDPNSNSEWLLLGLPPKVNQNYQVMNSG
jgi:hypothetical protein